MAACATRNPEVPGSSADTDLVPLGKALYTTFPTRLNRPRRSHGDGMTRFLGMTIAEVTALMALMALSWRSHGALIALSSRTHPALIPLSSRSHPAPMATLALFPRSR
ncbi:hypothetical protein Bbelb_343170 [Branchiostoma belcheri]|nr:hypothetical protein Bbelb_343170 [Branchiostoma belcheri]